MVHPSTSLLKCATTEQIKTRDQRVANMGILPSPHSARRESLWGTAQNEVKRLKLTKSVSPVLSLIPVFTLQHPPPTERVP